MKIGFFGVELIEGKAKYNDPRMAQLVEKCEPVKVSPYYAEFVKEESAQVDAIAVAESNLLDLLITDIEKFELRLERSEDTLEKELVKKCIKYLENEVPLCETVFEAQEAKLLNMLSPVSLKPVIVLEQAAKVNDIIEKALKKSNTIFFYTAGKKEVHAWDVKKDSTILVCAEKIHTDLARGFIKGDVVGFEDFLKCHSFNEAKTKGIAKVVDRDYLIQDGDIIEIRFNV